MPAADHEAQPAQWHPAGLRHTRCGTCPACRHHACLRPTTIAADRCTPPPRAAQARAPHQGCRQGRPQAEAPTFLSRPQQRTNADRATRPAPCPPGGTEDRVVRAIAQGTGGKHSRGRYFLNPSPTGVTTICDLARAARLVSPQAARYLACGGPATTANTRSIPPPPLRTASQGGAARHGSLPAIAPLRLP